MDHGFICKKCDGPAPVGIGYTDYSPGAAERSATRVSCPCGYSVKDETPTAGQGDEGNEQLSKSSPVTAYLAKWGDNTGKTYGTWSGESVPHKGHLTVILNVDSVAQMMDDGPVLIQINPGCVAKHDEHVRRYRAEQAEQERKRIRRELSDRITEEEGFEEQLAALDAQATAIYAQIDAQVDAILEKEGKQ